MGEARDITTVINKTTQPNCYGCTVGDGASGEEGFVNPDCAGNLAARAEKGLSTEACGLILMQYGVDISSSEVFNGRGITHRLTRTLRKIFIEPVGGRMEVLRSDYESRGNSELVVDLEPDHIG